MRSRSNRLRMKPGGRERRIGRAPIRSESERRPRRAGRIVTQIEGGVRRGTGTAIDRPCLWGLHQGGVFAKWRIPAFL